MLSIYFDCLTLYLTVSYKLLLMVFITNALTISSGEIFIICCGFEMGGKSNMSANICAPPKEGHLDLHCRGYHDYDMVLIGLSDCNSPCGYHNVTVTLGVAMMCCSKRAYFFR